MSPSVSWDDQRIFLAVLEEGSLSGAARRLGLSHPTVRARIEALERALGAALFTRSPRGLTPTGVALSLRAAARGMAAASDLFIRQASAAGEAAGVVRISVSEFMGVEVIPPMLARLRAAQPAIRLELALSNAPADLLAQEVDIAIRATRPKQAALTARKVAELPLGLYAAPAYLAARGAPARREDLAAHDLIGPDRDPLDLALVARIAPDFAPEAFALRTDSHPAQIAAARAGLGLVVIQRVVGDADPALRPVPLELNPPALGIWVVTHENLARTPRVRAVFDAFVAEFQALPGGEGAGAPTLRT
ncbi:MAG: LysR family transcriptional regulator [Pikeienuella sp.]